jgi:predicted Zn-dependent protease
MGEGTEDPEEWLDEANGELAVGNLDAAVAGYRRAVALDPGFFDGWHALGLALMKSGRLKEAIGAALQATTLRPNDQLAWTALSQMYVQDGQIAEAESAKQNATILGIGGKIVKD